MDEDKTSISEFEWKGEAYLRNIHTNDIIDIDDGDVVGKAVLGEDGSVVRVDFNGDDSDEDSDDDSDDESE